jgi:hypothetical protein
MSQKALHSPKNSILAALPPAEYKRLIPHLKNVSLKKGQVLHKSEAPILGFGSQVKRSLPFARVFVIAGISLSLIRLACYWTLFYLTSTGQQDFGSLLLVLPLLPEAALLPGSAVWSIGPRILFSGLLVIGSFLWAAILGWSLSGKKG